MFDTGCGLTPHIGHLGRFAGCWIFHVTWLSDSTPVIPSEKNRAVEISHRKLYQMWVLESLMRYKVTCPITLEQFVLSVASSN